MTSLPIHPYIAEILGTPDGRIRARIAELRRRGIGFKRAKEIALAEARARQIAAMAAG